MWRYLTDGSQHQHATVPIGLLRVGCQDPSIHICQQASLDTERARTKPAILRCSGKRNEEREELIVIALEDAVRRPHLIHFRPHEANVLFRQTQAMTQIH